jgi:hypothetical protein
MNPSSKPPAAQPAKPGPAGCLPGAAIITFLLLILLTGAAVILVLKPMNLMKYGLVQAMDQIETKLGRERTLSAEQYQELKVYVEASKNFISERNLNDRANLARVVMVSRAFRQALRDNVIDREELAAIRSSMWRANIPLPVQPRNPPAQQR